MNKLKHNLFRPPKPALAPHIIAARTTKSFNAIINCLSLENAHYDVLLTYSSMLKTHTPPDSYTFPSLLKACSSLNLISLGLSLHQHIIVNGYSSDAFIGSSLIHFYARFGFIYDAREVFEKMPERDVVPWTSIIGCYSRAGDVETAVFMFNRMRGQGIETSSITLLTLLAGVLEVTHVQYVHTCTMKYGLVSDLALMNSMLNVYGKCGRVEEARDLFESMERKDIVSWNTLISNYVLVGKIGVIDLLSRMKIEGVDPDQQTYGSLVAAIAKQSNLKMGKLVHASVLTAGFEFDMYVVTSLINMYLKCGNVEDAFLLFERTPNKDVVLWTAMVSGLVQNDCADKALSLFKWMLLSNVFPSPTTIATVLSACSQLGSLSLGTSIHAYILRKQIIDVAAQNSLITMYAKCSCLEQSRVIFYNMEIKDVVSWNAMVAAYAQNGDLYNSLCYFNEMRKTLERPDSITVVSLLQTSASIGALHQGKWIHTFVIRSYLGPCLLIDTALVDMYSKCGDLDIARKCFDMMPHHDLVSWTTIIAGYGSHGKGEIALEMYKKLLLTGIKPNPVVFLSVLSACSHNGLVDQGLNVFYTMKQDFRVNPEMEHLACVVDLLCRAGRVKEAHEFYKKMFSKSSVDVLGILLDACRASGDLELAEIISENIFSLKPVDGGKYLQVARSYASVDRWDAVSEAWIQMKSLGLKKLPGWSFIELNGAITTFFTYHSSHPRYENIIEVLKFLGKEIRDLRINFIREEIL